jgi:hypothetical protein
MIHVHIIYFLKEYDIEYYIYLFDPLLNGWLPSLLSEAALTKDGLFDIASSDSILLLSPIYS